MAEELIEFTRTGQVLMRLAEEVRMGYIKNLVRSGHPNPADEQVLGVP